MSDLFWLNGGQMERLKPFFPSSHGVSRVDDRRVLSGIICFIAMGCGGGMRQRAVAPTRLFTIIGSVGARWEYLAASGWNWSGRTPNRK